MLKFLNISDINAACKSFPCKNLDRICNCPLDDSAVSIIRASMSSLKNQDIAARILTTYKKHNHITIISK